MQSLFIINYEEDRGAFPLGKIEIGQHSVPFHFDGNRFLWLEYLENQSKHLNIYDYIDKSTKTVHTFEKSVAFVSHAKLTQSLVLFVQGQKHVNILDTRTNKIEPLYQHKHQIIALEMDDTAKLRAETIEEKDIMLDIKQDAEERKVPDEKTSLKHTDSITIVSIDTSENLYVYKNSKVTHMIPLREIPNFPKLQKKNYLFDMGYPYFVAFYGNYIAFTSDLGLFIIDITS